jgi:hypothetical protein
MKAEVLKLGREAHSEARNAGAQFTLYENLRRLVERRRRVAKLRTWEHLLLGGLSGATAASATMPLDFAKTVLQTGTSSQPIQRVFATQLREKGVGGLFAGMVRPP